MILMKKNNEVLELKMKVLKEVVNAVVNSMENITTPTNRGTRKRRKVKQTPSPAHNDADETDLEH